MIAGEVNHGLDGFEPQLGAFGPFGGRYASDLLREPLERLAHEATRALFDPDFVRELARELEQYAGRPTPITYARRLSRRLGFDVFLKREDLLHGGAHKTNNAIGQALLARRMDKTRLIAETGAGQHGIAVAMAGARYGFETVIYMGAVDAKRQAPNVEQMRLMGARVVEVQAGCATLNAAIDEALRDWTETSESTHYVLGTVCGPDPFPRLVANLQRVIGDEARRQMIELHGGPPDTVVACVGGGSNAIGIFRAFLDDPVRLVGVEAGGEGPEPGRHAAALTRGSIGLIHGARTYALQDVHGNVLPAHSVAPGLDYPGVGPEHAELMRRGRVRYEACGDREALSAFFALARDEGIIPALESAHALAWIMRPGSVGSGARVLVNLSGRGHKDLPTVLASRRAAADRPAGAVG